MGGEQVSGLLSLSRHRRASRQRLGDDGDATPTDVTMDIGADAVPSTGDPMLDSLHALSAWPALSDDERASLDAYVSSGAAGSDPSIFQSFAAQPDDAQLAMLRQTAAAVAASTQAPPSQYDPAAQPQSPDSSSDGASDGASADPSAPDPYAQDQSQGDPSPPDSSNGGSSGGDSGGGASGAAPSDASLDQATNDATTAARAAVSLASLFATSTGAGTASNKPHLAGPAPDKSKAHAAIQRANATAARAEKLGRAAMRTKPSAGRKAIAAAAAARAAARKLSSAMAKPAAPKPTPAPKPNTGALAKPRAAVTQWRKPSGAAPHTVARPRPPALGPRRGVHGLQLLGVRAVVGGGPDTVYAPYRVTVSPPGSASSDFGPMFPPVPPAKSPIDRVVVTGGKKWVPAWDKTSTAYDGPDQVDVYLVGQSQPQSFRSMQSVTIYGGGKAFHFPPGAKAALRARPNVLGAWFSGSDEAHAGIRAVRTLKAMYDSVVAAHPDAAKYAAQVDPLVAGADKWDAAIVFYVNDDAVELGRRAQAVSQQIATEYNQPTVAIDPALAQGILEKAQQAGGKGIESAGDLLHYLPWIIGGVAIVAAGAIGIPAVLSVVHAAKR